MISTPQKLIAFCEPLLSSHMPLAIGIDTEFIRKQTYWPKLCLIQITNPLKVPYETILIDPLSNLDLSLFQALLVAPHLTKVIHSARQDIEIFWHKWQVIPQPFFDTQIAAMVCGLGDGIGYSSLVKMLFNKELEKESQYTDWSRRPLTKKQWAYAIADATYLLPTFEFLRQQLTTLNRWEWMKDDLETLLKPTTYNLNPQQAWLRIRTHRYKPQNLALLQDICAWRETIAMQLNVNRGRLLRDECILKIGLKLPKTIDDLKMIANSSSLTDELAKELFSIYQIALSKPKEFWPDVPKKPSLPIPTRHHLAILREKLNKVATSLNVPARLIAPKNDLIALAEGRKEGNPILTGWRYKVFGYMVADTII